MYAITDVVVCAHGKSLKMRYKFSIAIIVMNNDIWNIGNIHHVIDRGIIKNNQLLVNYYYYRPLIGPHPTTDKHILLTNSTDQYD